LQLTEAPVPDSYDAVVAGHICIDMIPDLSGSAPDQFRAGFAPGHLLQIGPAAFSTGGPVSNTGLAFHRLGIPTRLMGKVGDDLFGHAALQMIAGYGPELAAGMLVDPTAPTSYSVVISPPGLDRMFLHCTGANDAFGEDDVDYSSLERARIFHFGYPPLMPRMYAHGGEELTAIFRRARATGVTTSLDMAVPDPASPAGRADWGAILRATLPFVDVFLPSIEEILYMLRRETFEELCATARLRGGSGSDVLALIGPALLYDVSGQLLDMGVKVAGLKLGDRGFYLRTGSRTALESMGRAGPAQPAQWATRELWSPCFRVNVAGTVGSGDATIAGFLAALLRGFSPEAALTAGVAVGACNVEAADALSGLRSWEATMARVSAGWSRHALILDAPGWCFDPPSGLWSRG
jgi:sugar/nucleoside kinase (ribokinase family)